MTYSVVVKLNLSYRYLVALRGLTPVKFSFFVNISAVEFVNEYLLFVEFAHI